MAADRERIDRLLGCIVAAMGGDYSARVPLEDTENELLELELGVNYLLEELGERRQQNVAQREALLAQSDRIAAQSATLVEALSTPIIAVWPGVLALPLIGPIDAERANRINEVLLARVVADRASHVVLDLTGVESIDSSTVAAILQMIGAMRLLGASCLVTGINSRGARQMVDLGADFRRFRTLGRVSDALQLILNEKRA